MTHKDDSLLRPFFWFGTGQSEPSSANCPLDMERRMVGGRARASAYKSNAVEFEFVPRRSLVVVVAWSLSDCRIVCPLSTSQKYVND